MNVRVRFILKGESDLLNLSRVYERTIYFHTCKFMRLFCLRRYASNDLSRHRRRVWMDLAEKKDGITRLGEKGSLRSFKSFLYARFRENAPGYTNEENLCLSYKSDGIIHSDLRNYTVEYNYFKKQFLLRINLNTIRLI